MEANKKEIEEGKGNKSPSIDYPQVSLSTSYEFEVEEAKNPKK